MPSIMDAQPYQAPQADLAIASVFCRQCGSKIAADAKQCPSCLASQNLNPKSRITAGVLALFLGGLGIHRLYLGQWWGVVYLLFWGTGIPSVVSLIESIVFFCSTESTWQRKYGNVKGGSSAVIAIVGVVVFVAVVGILAAIAIPQYQHYVERAKQLQLEQQR
jgi:TM2 domain-containing membrane protein YozV